MTYINHRGGWPEQAPESKPATSENSNVVTRGLARMASFLGGLTLDKRDAGVDAVPRIQQDYYDKMDHFSVTSTFPTGTFPDEAPSEPSNVVQLPNRKK